MTTGSPITVIVDALYGGYRVLHLQFMRKVGPLWARAYGYDSAGAGAGATYHSVPIELEDKNKTWFEGHIPKDDPRILAALVARALSAEV
jgi:hypothetical protein